MNPIPSVEDAVEGVIGRLPVRFCGSTLVRFALRDALRKRDDQWRAAVKLDRQPTCNHGDHTAQQCASVQGRLCEKREEQMAKDKNKGRPTEAVVKDHQEALEAHYKWLLRLESRLGDYEAQVQKLEAQVEQDASIVAAARQLLAALGGK